MIRVGILGSRGKMGQTVMEILKIRYAEKATVVAQMDQPPKTGESFEEILKTDLIIDFSSPTGMMALAQAAIAQKEKLPVFVVGTTGWNLDGKRVLEELGKKTFILMSSNFSLGVLAVIDAIKQLAPFLDHFKYDPVVIETHHKHKKDSPSGTAISFQRAISPRGAGNVPIQSIRADEVVGDHEARFYGSGDEIIIRHTAKDRSIFAEGAIEAGFWLLEKKAVSTPLGLMGIEGFFKDIKEKLK